MDTVASPHTLHLKYVRREVMKTPTTPLPGTCPQGYEGGDFACNVTGQNTRSVPRESLHILALTGHSSGV